MTSAISKSCELITRDVADPEVAAVQQGSLIHRALKRSSNPKIGESNSDVPRGSNDDSEVESWEMLFLEDKKGIIPIPSQYTSSNEIRRDSGVNPTSPKGHVIYGKSDNTDHESSYTYKVPNARGKGKDSQGLRVVTQRKRFRDSPDIFEMDWTEEPPNLFTPQRRASGAAISSPVYPQAPALSARIPTSGKSEFRLPTYYYPLWPRSPLLGHDKVALPPHIGEALEQPRDDFDHTGMLHSAHTPH